METTEIKSKESIISINIDGDWSASEFSIFFDGLNLLYRLLIELENIEYIEVQLSNAKSKTPLTEDFIRINESYYKRLKYSNFYTKSLKSYKPFLKHYDLMYQIYDLQVDKIKFASPGFSDFVGIGKIMETLFELLKYYFPNKQDKYRTKLMEEDLISKKIDNLNKIGYSANELEKYEILKNSALSGILDLQYDGKIKSIKLKEKTEE